MRALVTGAHPAGRGGVGPATMTQDERAAESAELHEQEAERERAERRLAEETGEHAAVRRADKHAYLREKLEEREKSEDG